MRGHVGRCRWLCVGVTAVMALAAIVAALAWPVIFDSALASQLTLTPTSRTFREWEAPTVPLIFDVYLFNWTNADKFPEEAPHVQQLGPYSFKEDRRHTNITWHPKNDSVSYRTHRTWYFNPATSNGSLDDNVTTLNAIAASAVYRSRDWGFIRQKGMSMGLTMFGHKVAVTKKAGEFLFEGYEDPLLELAKSMPASATGNAPPVDRFGWFFGRNSTFDTEGQMSVSTGAGRGTLPGQILQWNYEDRLPYYEGECAKLIGSVGEFMPRDLTEDSTLDIFMAELCRSIHLEYTESGEIKGLKYHKYSINENTFDNSTLYHDNTCFCNGECAWTGVMNVSACRYGSPSFISLPHFLHADPELRTLVTGLDPDPEKHSFYFGVEPELGVPIDVTARFQLNMYIEQNENVALYMNMPRMLFPMFWVEQQVIVEDRVALELRSVRIIKDWGAVFCAGVALFFAIFAIGAICSYLCRPRQTKYVPPSDLMFEKPKDEAELKLNPM